MVASGDALVIVDMQKDFVTGSLAVPGALEIVPGIVNIANIFKDYGNPIFCTKDWHPEDHKSFKENGGQWPRHCVRYTEGAELIPELKEFEEYNSTFKGKLWDDEGYSAITSGDLAWRLDMAEIERIIVCGVATEYCVKETCMDAKKKLGLAVILLRDLVCGVDPIAAGKAEHEMGDWVYFMKSTQIESF